MQLDPDQKASRKQALDTEIEGMTSLKALRLVDIKSQGAIQAAQVSRRSNAIPAQPGDHSMKTLVTPTGVILVTRPSPEIIGGITTAIHTTPVTPATPVLPATIATTATTVIPVIPVIPVTPSTRGTTAIPAIPRTRPTPGIPGILGTPATSGDADATPSSPGTLIALGTKVTPVIRRMKIMPPTFQKKFSFRAPCGRILAPCTPMTVSSGCPRSPHLCRFVRSPRCTAHYEC